MKFTGILYLREITETRMKGTAVKNLNMFRKLCGTETLGSVVLVTTKWDKVDPDEGESRERELRQKYWKTMIDMGATMARHDNTARSAHRILGTLLGNPEIVLNIQHQLVDEGKTLQDTDAGAAINKEVHELRKTMAKELAENVKAMREEQNQALKSEYEKHQLELEAAIKKAEKDLKALEEDRTREINELRKQIEERAGQEGKTTSDYIWEGVGNVFKAVVASSLKAVLIRSLG